MGLSGIPISYVSRIVQGDPTTSADSKTTLGSFSVSTSAATSPSDIAKAASLQYHISKDVDPEHTQYIGHRNLARRKKGFRSKFAKKSIAEDEEYDDPDVDEATGEESPHNDSKYKRLHNVHIAKKFKRNR